MRALPSERLPLLFFKGEIGISRGTVRSKILERERDGETARKREEVSVAEEAVRCTIFFVELTDSTKSQANALVSWTTPDLPNTNFDEPEK